MVEKTRCSIPGFEAQPQGRLLRQLIDFSRDVGIAYERCIGYVKPTHLHDRVTLTFPRGSSRSETLLSESQLAYALDASVMHWMALGVLHSQRALSTIYDTFALYPTTQLVHGVAEAVGLSKEQGASLISLTVKAPRNRLVDDLVDRLFFYRVLSPEVDHAVTSALERQLLSEVIACLVPVTARVQASHVAVRGNALQRGLEFIETKLFEPITIGAICDAARVSQATFFRAFRAELQMTPFAYIRSRRLDEAEALLRTGQYQVADVALLVGYEDLSAFSKAFKLHFKRSPSTSLPKT